MYGRFTQRAQRAIAQAQKEAAALHQRYVGTEHLLLAAIREENSACYRFFERASIQLETVRNVIRDLQNENGGEEANDEKGEAEFANARNNENPNQSFNNKNIPLNLLEIYSNTRRTKNNPCLIGEPGVGKTSVAEGLAQRVASGEVPYNLLQKRVLLLDITAMVAGTKYRGDFEERMKRMMKEVKDSGDIIRIEGLGAFTDEEMRAFAEAVRPIVPCVRLRGVEE